MGCVSSRILTKTGSFREELGRSLKGRHQVLQGLFISASTNGGADQFIVICKDGEEDKLSKTTAVQTTDKLSSPPHTINTWDLMEGLDEKEDQEEKTSSMSNAVIQRSQSFNGFASEYESSSSAIGFNGSRSFHTVEEFDAIMMQRNGKTWEDELDRDFLARMTVKGVEETSSNVKVSANEKGLGRKKMAMELTSLAIPSAIEFPVAATSEGLEIVNYYSAEVDYYETPKFGSYGLSIIPSNTEEDPVLDQEFLSAFQEEMEKLEAEEDFLLRQVYS
ncbi:hypothetical protein ACHQM5_004261 [Ranunculus cassubicifolius]